MFTKRHAPKELADKSSLSGSNWNCAHVSSTAFDPQVPRDRRNVRTLFPMNKVFSNIGLIGTGVIGIGIGSRLLNYGHKLTVHDRRPEAAVNLLERGAAWADMPRAVAEVSEIVLTSLPGPQDVEAVVLDPATGVLAGLHPGNAYIDLSTNSPASFRRVADRCKQKGIEVLDAPVSGRPPETTIMAGGEKATFDRFRMLLECIGQRVFYAGSTGMGMTAKAVNQFITFANFLVQAEGLLIGKKAGLNVDTLAQIIAVSSGRSLQLDAFPRVVFRGDFDTNVTAAGPLTRWIKDLSCTREVADDAAWARILKIAEGVLSDAEKHGWGENAWQGAARVLEEMAGLKLRVSPGD
jgi:3-hydroxyisobutyrate dehydrogenase-like beta-hydroxyacid dehydrogenase